MAHWPTRQGYAGVVSAARSTTGTTASVYDMKTVTGGAIGIKGSWVELIASTARDSHRVDVVADATTSSTFDTSILLDIGIGAAGSEKVLIPDLGVGFVIQCIGAASNGMPALYEFPLYIPAGSRVAARIAGTILNDTAQVGVDLYGGMPPGGFPVGSGVDTYGVGAGSKGVTITSGATIAVKGAWAEIEDSTPNPIKGLAFSVQGSTGSLVSARHGFDIGVGAAGSEKIVVPDIPVGFLNNEQIVAWRRGVWLLDQPIPAGSRLAVRGANSLAATADTDASVHLHGLRG